MAPEYSQRGQLSTKVDVYSFGLLAIEVVCGKLISCKPEDGELENMLDWVRKHNLHILADKLFGFHFQMFTVLLVIIYNLL